MLSGVAKIVSAISSVDNPSQSSAFSSRQSNPSSTLSESCCALVDVVVSVSFCANAGAIENSSRNRTTNAPTFFMYR